MGATSKRVRRGACASTSIPLAPAIQWRRRGHVTLATVQGLIGRAYDAAIDPALWPSFLEDLSDAIGGSSAVFLGQDRFRRRVDFISASRIDVSHLGTYSAHFAAKDVWAQGSFGFTAGTVVGSAALVPGGDFIKSEFYNDFLRSVDIYHMVSAVVENHASNWSTVSVFRPKRARDFNSDEHNLIRILSPHLRRAAEIRRRFVQLQTTVTSVVNVLDELPAGVIILDKLGGIVAINRSANSVIKQDDGLTTAPMGLKAATPRQTQHLRALIEDAANTVSRGGLGAGGAMALARPSQKRPFAVLVTPLRLPEFALDIEGPAVAVFVRDPERQLELSADVLGRHHGLTPAESRLASALARGASLKCYAAEAEITMNTARWTLKQVFAKTDTKRQAELVRLLLCGLAGLGIG